MAGTVITVAQQKGGAGKTTLLAQLAVAILKSGRSVAAIDIDPQGSLTQWHEERVKTLGKDDLLLSQITGWRTTGEVERLAQRHDVVMIDSPPHAETEARIAVRAAKLVVVPVQPSPMDFWATRPTLDLARLEKRQALLVLNRVPPRGRLADELVAKAGELGAEVAAVRVGNRVGYADAMMQGLSVVEVNRSGRAAKEIDALAEEILAAPGDRLRRTAAALILVVAVIAGAPAAPASAQDNTCRTAFDGRCDEPVDGTGRCRSWTDTADCRGDFVAGGERSLFGRDDRVTEDARRYPWSAIGRVYFESGRSCTATLVAANVAITAAHCLYTGGANPRRDRATEFIAGLNGDSYVARTDVLFASSPPEFEMRRYVNSSEIDGYDWAFLILGGTPGRRAGTLEVRMLEESDLRQAMAGEWYPVILAGYGAGDGNRLTAHIDCPIVEMLPNNTIYTHCDTVEGSSGSPLFIDLNGTYQIIGVHSAVYPNRGGPYDFKLAVDARAFYGPLARLLSGQP